MREDPLFCFISPRFVFFYDHWMQEKEWRVMRMFQNATGEGKICAAHALAKLGAKVDPEIAFPGQRAYEV